MTRAEPLRRALAAGEWERIAMCVLLATMQTLREASRADLDDLLALLAAEDADDGR